MRPFVGIKVLDLTHVLAGPFCTYQLALLGAETIKIERPGEPDCVRGRGTDPRLNAAGMGINFQTQGSNKRSLSLDLSSCKGKDIFKRLAAAADVIIENYRAGALQALGLGYASLSEHNPRLIYCSITGFGQHGPRAHANAYDNAVQAASGMMSRTGGEHAPIKTGASIIDYATGLNAAFAIASALFARQRTGNGQFIDCAMFDTALQLMGPELVSTLHEVPQKTALVKEAGLDCYRTADGLLMLGAFNVRQNRRLWTELGRADFAALSTWEELWRAASAMRSALAKIMLTRTAEEWEGILHGIGVPAERVRSLDEAARMPQLAARGLLQDVPSQMPDVPDLHVPMAAFTYAQDGPQITSPPPRFGEHTDEILGELGLAAHEIQSLRQEGIV